MTLKARMQKVAVGIAATSLCVTFAYSATQGELDTSVDPNTYTITVAADAADVTLNDEDVEKLGTGVTLVKEGKGRLIIDKNLKAVGYDGLIKVNAGYLQAKNDAGALGGITKGTEVTAGATLEFYMTDGKTGCCDGEALSFAGKGVDDHGAIYVVHNDGEAVNGFCARLDQALTHTMTGDATVGYVGDDESVYGAFTMRNATLNMGTHTLTLQHVGGNDRFKGISVSSPGHIVVCKNVFLQIENGSLLKGSAANTFTLKDGATLSFGLNQNSHYWGGYSTTPWTLITEGKATFNFDSAQCADAGDGGGKGWGGPIQLGGMLYMKQNGSVTVFPRLDGTISGTGGITFAYVKNGANKYRLVGHNNSTRSNSYTGGTFVEAGVTLDVSSLGLIPTGGRVSVPQYAKLNLEPINATDTNTFTEAAITAVMKKLSADDDFVTFGSEVNVNFDFTLASGLLGPLMLSPGAGYDLAIDSSLAHGETATDSVDLQVRPGSEVAISTGGQVGPVQVNGGELEVAETATVLSTNSVYVGGTYPKVGRLAVRGNWNGVNASPSIFTGRLAGSCGANERGIFEIFDGATVSSVMEGGATVYNARATGSYFFHGGTFNDIATTERFYADCRHGYFSVEPGATWKTKSSARWGRTGTSILHVRGGTAEFAGYPNYYQFAVNSGSSDVLVDNGGKLTFADGVVQLVRPVYEGGAQAAVRGIFTVEGEGSSLSFTISRSNINWVDFVLASARNSEAIINLNQGGKLISPMFTKAKQVYDENKQEVDSDETSVACINFNGGEIEVGNDFDYRNTLFVNFSNGVDHVYVYGGGATIKAAYDRKLGAALEAPSGNGISAITLPEAVTTLAAWEYTGAPWVSISDATGKGASAVAIYDTTNGVVTAIKVTSRGVNYTNPTITLRKGGYTSDIVIPAANITLSENVSGGFTKTGLKTLTFDRIATYTGVTIVAEGTLKQGVAGAFDNSAEIVVAAGATLNLNGLDCKAKISGEGKVIGRIMDLAAHSAIDSWTSPTKLTITVAEGTEDDHLEASDLEILEAYPEIELCKAGLGRLLVSNDLAAIGWDGKLSVTEGRLQAWNNHGLGGTTGITKIVEGASLEVVGCTNQFYESFVGEKVEVGGAGFGGNGAIYFVSYDNNTYEHGLFASGSVKLTSDTTVGYGGEETCKGGFALRNCTLDMGGYKLTLQRSSVASADRRFFKSVAVSNPGSIMVKTNTVFSIENGSTLGGDATHVLTIEDGSEISFVNQVASVWYTPWTLDILGNATYNLNFEGTNQGWYGPILVGKRLVRRNYDRTTGVMLGNKAQAGLVLLFRDRQTLLPPLLPMIVTDAGVLSTNVSTASNGYHIQGFCADKDYIYVSQLNQLSKFDWQGHFIKSIDVPQHEGDICVHDGYIYAATAYWKDYDFIDEGCKGSIRKYDTDLNFIAKQDFTNAFDGITYHQGLLHAGYGGTQAELHPIDPIATIDPETLQMVDCRDFRPGYDTYSTTQNQASDGTCLYFAFYSEVNPIIQVNSALEIVDYPKVTEMFGNVGTGLEVMPKELSGPDRTIFMRLVHYHGGELDQRAKIDFFELKDGVFRSVTAW